MLKTPLVLLVSSFVGLGWTLSAVAQMPTTPPTPTTQPAVAEPAIHEYEKIPGIMVKITELKRTASDTLTLRWSYINTTDAPIDLDPNGYYDLAEKVYLLDLPGKKQYRVLQAGGYPLGRKHGYEVIVPAGKEYTMWVRFPAPPATVTKIDVYIEGVSEPFDGVPITK